MNTITNEEFAKQVMDQAVSGIEMPSEYKEESELKIAREIASIDDKAAFVGYFIESINAMPEREGMGTLMNVRVLRWFIADTHRAFMSGISVNKTKKVDAAVAIEAKKEAKHKEMIASIKISNQGVKKSENICRAKMIGTIEFKVTDEGLEVTMPSHNIVGGKSSTIIRSYLKSRGVKRIGKTIDDGVLFKPELIQEIIDILGLNAKTLIEMRETQTIEAMATGESQEDAKASTVTNSLSGGERERVPWVQMAFDFIGEQVSALGSVVSNAVDVSFSPREPEIPTNPC